MNIQNFPMDNVHIVCAGRGRLRKSRSLLESITEHRHRRIRGFTLIELMVVVAVIGILASIALPSYRESVAKGARAEGRATLLQAAQWMERHYTENNRYDQFANGDSVTTASLPGSLTKAPTEGAARYNLTMTLASQTYTLKMVRAGSQASDRCGDYMLTNLGVKSAENYTGFSTLSNAVQGCWK